MSGLRALLAALIGIGAAGVAGAQVVSDAPASAAEPAPNPFIPQHQVIGVQAGLRIRGDPALALGVDVETRPFISRFAGLRFGLTWVAASDFRGENPPQLGARAQVTASWWRLEAAVGGILLKNQDSYNTGRLNTCSGVDFALTRQWRLRAEHWSNGRSRYPNVGRNMLLIGFRF